MKSGYKIKWTTNALKELAETIEYLENNFTDREINRLGMKIEQTIQLISQNPALFPESSFKNVRRAVILKFNTIYYRVSDDIVEILSFFQTDKILTKERYFKIKYCGQNPPQQVV